MNTIKIMFYDEKDLLAFRDKLQEEKVNYYYNADEDDTEIAICDVIIFSKILNRNTFYIEIVNKNKDVVYFDLTDNQVYSVEIC